MNSGGVALGANHLPGTASLIAQLDKRVMVVLRDGRHLIGTLRSIDNFSNFVLEDTCQRIIVNKNFGDIPLGLYLLRGDNVVLLGEVDDESEARCDLKRLSQEDILAAKQAAIETEEKNSGTSTAKCRIAHGARLLFVSSMKYFLREIQIDALKTRKISK